MVTFTSKIAIAYELPQAKQLQVSEASNTYGAQPDRKELPSVRAEDEKELQVLAFCRIPRSRQEIIDFLGFSRYYTMCKIVQPLLDGGKLALTLPDKPKSSKQRYYTLLQP